jgi:hypothetical protein
MPIETKIAVTKVVRLEEFPANLHIKVQQYQIKQAEQGLKITFPEACYELITKALSA